MKEGIKLSVMYNLEYQINLLVSDFRNDSHDDFFNFVSAVSDTEFITDDELKTIAIEYIEDYNN